MFCRCYFLSYSFSLLFLTIACSKEISETTRPVFTKFSRMVDMLLGVDVQSGMGFAIGQGTLPWQPILGAKSDSHSTADGRMGKRIV